jgi:3',5'-cyclic AMP phosphodiesterase CpdA
MTGTFTFAHLSDLHLSAEHKRHNLRRADRLLSFIKALEVDHIVMTGDLAADARSKDFEVARRLFKSYGLLDPEKLSVIPGNHDIYGGVHTAEDILTFPRRVKETEYPEKVEEFREYFRETFSRALFASPTHPFPYAKEFGDVALIGVNSVARHSRVNNPLGSNGEVDDGQFRRLRLLLEAPPLQGKRKIVMIHHHFRKIASTQAGAVNSVWAAIERRTMKMRGKKRLFEIFREHNVDIVLHGHVHYNESYERKGVRFLNGGGSLLGPQSPSMTLNLVRVSEDAVETRTILVPEEIPALPAAVANPFLIPESAQLAA